VWCMLTAWLGRSPWIATRIATVDQSIGSIAWCVIVHAPLLITFALMNRFEKYFINTNPLRVWLTLMEALMGRTNSNQGLTWRKAHKSMGNGHCVEVAETADGMILVRNSKNLRGPVVRYTADEWNAFLARAKNGEFDNKGRSFQATTTGANDQFGTVNLRAFLRALISAATENEETLNRHLKLLRFARATILTATAMMLLGSLIFGAGVAAAVVLAGMHVAVAISIGAGGSASFILTVFVRCRRYLRVFLGALSEIEPADPKSDA
jgi:hypothetical protein